MRRQAGMDRWEEIHSRVSKVGPCPCSISWRVDLEMPNSRAKLTCDSRRLRRRFRDNRLLCGRAGRLGGTARAGGGGVCSCFFLSAAGQRQGHTNGKQKADCPYRCSFHIRILLKSLTKIFRFCWRNHRCLRWCRRFRSFSRSSCGSRWYG